jgi:hypothetical protein
MKSGKAMENFETLLRSSVGRIDDPQVLANLVLYGLAERVRYYKGWGTYAWDGHRGILHWLIIGAFKYIYHTMFLQGDIDIFSEAKTRKDMWIEKKQKTPSYSEGANKRQKPIVI